MKRPGSERRTLLLALPLALVLLGVAVTYRGAWLLLLPPTGVLSR